MTETVFLLDTDLGMDCDDAGAMAILHRLAPHSSTTIGAMVSSAPLSASPALIQHINSFFGTQMPIGRVCAPTAAPSYQDVYAGEVLCRCGTMPPYQDFDDAVRVLRLALTRCADHSVVYTAIGPQTNMAALLRSVGDDISPLTGAALLQQKLRRTVVMAGRFVDRSPEFNVVVDAASAQLVAKAWPGEMVYVSHELGAALISGNRFSDEQYNTDPIAMCYAVHSGHDGRYSWDPVAVYQALFPNNPLFSLGELGQVTIDNDGVSVFTNSDGGRHRLLYLAASAEEVEKQLSEYICG